MQTSKLMVILESNLLNQFPRIAFGFSTKVGPGEAPYFFNLSLSVGDDEEKVKQNRSAFLLKLGIKKIAYQKQVHGDMIRYVDNEGFAGESDALITDKPGLGIMVSAADCPSIYLYDHKKQVIAGVHAGWRSTELDILDKTLVRLNTQFGCSPDNLAAYIAPSISCNVYEVDKDVAFLFPEKYYKEKGSKYLLDVAGKNYDTLLGFGVQTDNIQYSNLCTYQLHSFLHSYRRGGVKSGRSVGIIAMKAEV